MTKFSNRILLIFHVTFCSALTGCVTYSSLSPDLDKAVGKQMYNVKYPDLNYHKLISEDDSTSIVEYSLGPLWRCRWIFEIRKKDEVITSWRYPDADAAKWCQKLPTTRP